MSDENKAMLDQLTADLARLQDEIEQPAEPYGGEWRGLELSVGDFSESGSCGIPGIIMDRNTGRQFLRLIAAAGTAAHRAREMGYDPIEVMQALPELLLSSAYLSDILARAAGKEAGDE